MVRRGSIENLIDMTAKPRPMKKLVSSHPQAALPSRSPAATLSIVLIALLFASLSATLAQTNGRTLLPAEVAHLYRSELGPDPTIYLNGPSSLRIELDSVFVDPGAVVIDDKDEERSILGSGSVDTSTVGTYTLTYTATDSVGNEALPVTRVVEVGTDWVYSVNGSNEVTITGYTGPGGNVTVPNTLGGHPVKNFGNGQSVFGWLNNSVTNVVLPSSVTAIGDYAFAWSTSLTQLSLPSGLTSIGNGALKNTAISALQIPQSVTSIGIFAFASCPNLTSLDWPAGVTTIPDSAFSGSGLTQFTIPATVTRIDYSAFANCRNLTSLAIPNGVTSIGSYAFGGTGLTSIVLPGSIEYIGDNNNNWWGGGWWSGWDSKTVYGLSDCASLTSLTISEGTKGINAGAFANLRYLTNIVIAGSVTSIGNGAFYGAGSYMNWLPGPVRTLSILPASDAPYSSINIGDSAFGDSGITDATITRELVSFGFAAFAYSYRLASLNLASSVNVFDFGDSSFAYCSSLTTIGTPASVYRVGSRAFEGSGLTSVSLPGISSIGDYAFSGVSALTRAEIGRGPLYVGPVVSIGGYAFANCNSLSELAFPTTGASAISVGSFAFANCTSLTNVTFPESSMGWEYGGFIGTQAFDGCTNLASVTIGSSIAFSSVFSNCPKLTTATLSMGFPSGFRGVSSLVNATILRGYVQDYAFNGCSNLSSVTLAEGVRTIDDQAFGNCPRLTSITIPASVTVMWENPFQGSTNLVRINVSVGNLNYFDDGGVLYSGSPTSPGALVAYPAAKSGKSLQLPQGLTDVPSGAFAFSRYLETVTFPSSLTSIGYGAFASSSVVGLYFEGDAPWTWSGSPFEGMLPAATVYCYAPSNGFTLPTWNGLPVIVMNSGTTSVRSWLQSAGFDPATSLTADPGQRGVPLLQAYAFNMDPHSRQNTQVPQPQMAGQTMSMRFYASSPGVNYVVETSDDLRSWTTNNVTVSLPDDSGHSTATMPMNASRRFMRIKLTGPQ